MAYLLQGLALGIAYVAPIGVQNLFVINTALRGSRRRAYLTALAVIFFDVTLALACFFGIGALVQAFPQAELVILAGGSVVLVYMGITLLRAKPTSQAGGNAEQVPALRTVGIAFSVAWLNPQAIIDGTLMLGAFRVSLPGEQATFLLIGVLAASCIWFTALTTLVQLFSSWIGPRTLGIVNKVCGAVVLLYGLRLAIRLVISLRG